MPDAAVLLQPKQHELLTLLEATGPDVPRRIGWGGSRGAAKSGGLRRVAMVLASSYPGIVIVIIRKHLGDLIENHVQKMALEYPDFHKRYYKLSQYEWQLDNRSRIVLAYGDTPKDIQEFSRGPEYTFAFIDQAEQFTEQELVWLTIPNRWPAAAQGFAKSAFFFNPGGPGTEFLRRVFHLKEFKKHEVPHEWHFVQAYGFDNYVWFQNELPLTSQEFYQIPAKCSNFPLEDRLSPQCCRYHLFIHETSEGRKMNALAPSLRVGELLGSFESFSGQYFAGVWDEGQCVVSSSDARVMIQPWWRRWASIDWGFAHMTAVIWFAAGKLSPLQFQAFFGSPVEWPVDIVIAYRELVVNETAESDLALRIVDMTPADERPHLRDIYLSPDAFAKKGSASTVSDQLSDVFRRLKMPKVDRAMNDRVPGWRMMYNLMRQTRGLRAENPDPARAKAGPMFVVSADCPELIQAIPLAVRDEKNLEDILKTPTVADDVIDAARYGLASHLSPKDTAPLEVRAAEAVTGIQDNTARAMILNKFHSRNGGAKPMIRRNRFR